MKYPKSHPLFPLFVILVTTLAGLGCETAYEPSTTAPLGYAFAQDFELERRVLRLGFSAEDPARCMQSALPTNGNVVWKSTVIDASLYEALLDLARDEERILQYESDTLAIECNDWNCVRDCSLFEGESYDQCISTRPSDDCVPDHESCIPVERLEECSPRPNDIEFCYIPEASTSVDNGPWRFALSPEFAPPISGASEALIEAFLDAHEACWSP